jgi:mRNA-degrading endonuclease RelE of RelBE toxin-antitoxin system
MEMTVDFLQTPEFEKEFNKLSKKYPSLRDDFRNFLKALKSLLPGAVPGTVRISNFSSSLIFPPSCSYYY